MSLLLVSGLVNIETTLRVGQFPVANDPARYPFFRRPDQGGRRCAPSETRSSSSP